MSRAGHRRVNPCPPLAIYSSRASRARSPWRYVLLAAALIALPAILEPKHVDESAGRLTARQPSLDASQRPDGQPAEEGAQSAAPVSTDAAAPESANVAPTTPDARLVAPEKPVERAGSPMVSVARRGHPRHVTRRAVTWREPAAPNAGPGSAAAPPERDVDLRYMLAPTRHAHGRADIPRDPS